MNLKLVTNRKLEADALCDCSVVRIAAVKLNKKKVPPEILDRRWLASTTLAVWQTRSPRTPSPKLQQKQVILKSSMLPTLRAFACQL